MSYSAASNPTGSQDQGRTALVSAETAIQSYEPQIGADHVNPLSTSAFDLRDRLTPKADPTLIAGDERHFAAIADSLVQSIAELSDRLDAGSATTVTRCSPLMG
jgi:hypothetical protein